MQKVQSISIILNHDEKNLVEKALSSIRENGFFHEDFQIQENQIKLSPYDFAEVIARTEKKLQTEMLLYRLRKQALEKINPNSFEYYLVAGVQIGHKAHATKRRHEPITLLD